jgi:hypothetical protein
MRRIIPFGISASILFLAAVQSSSSKAGTPARIQNRDTVERLYGNPVSEVYTTSQNLTITASFASDGNLCRAHIKSGVDDTITDAQLNAALDELAPKDVRGEFKIATFLDGTCLKLQKPEMSMSSPNGKPVMDLAVDACAECSGVSDDYEQATITKYGNTNQYSSVWISFHRAECKALETAHY